MKTTSYHAFVLLLCCIFCLTVGCEDEKSTDKSNPVAITGIYPNSNPVGGPVLIEGEGFTEETEVYFNNIVAIIEERSDTFLTTKVPAGLGAVSVTVRVENRTRNNEALFDVLSDFPSDLPASPLSIIIPPSGLVSPIFISQDAPCYYSLRNVYNPDHRMRMNIYNWLAEEECNPYCEISEKIGDKYFPLRHMWENEDVECGPNDNLDRELVWVAVDRSGSLYKSDAFTAHFFTNENFDYPGSFIPPENDWERVTNNFLLLTSEITGRQYLFVVTNYGFGGV